MRNNCIFSVNSIQIKILFDSDSRGNQKYIFNFPKDPEAVAQKCSVKKVLLEISQNSEENTCARVSFLIKLQAIACRSCYRDL